MEPAGLERRLTRGYKVYRGTTSGGETLVATLGTATTYTDATPTGGVAYYYRVSGFNSLGEGTPSNERSARPTTRDTTAPSKPANLKVVVEGTNQLALDWSPSTDNVGVTAYRVFRDGAPVGSVSETEYLDSGLSAGTGYTFSVRAVDAAGNVSAASNNLNAKTVSSANGSTGTLAGAVYDGTGKPLANAVVSITVAGSVKTAKTNASGTWKLGNLQPGSYSPSVSLTGYRTQTVSINAVAGKTVLAATLLAPA